MNLPASSTAPPSTGTISPETVRRALRRWHQLELGHTALATTLLAVREAVRQGDSPESPLVRSHALRQIFNEGLESMRRDGFEDAATLLHRQFVSREPFMLIASDLGLGERHYFNRQGRAIELLAGVLAELEAKARRRAEQARAAPVGGDSGVGASVALPAAPGNLPAPLASFIGREREQAELRGLLRHHRLVTLTGVGGTGKTRLALELAHAVVDDYPDGAWWVELARLTDPGLVVPEVAAALGVRKAPGQTEDEAVRDFLASRRLLIVLDNCEHLIETCAQVAYAWLRAAPDLTILATSREALDLVGEQVWQVPQLAVPEASTLPRDNDEVLSVLSRVDAVRLFVERAALVRAGFTLTTENAAAVAQLCRKLEGIPLAIELAAARMKLLSPEQMLVRLEDRFAVLKDGGRVAEHRQQTLHGAIAWSYDLLPDQEKVLFARLSVFRGGWTLEAAEAVGAGGAIGLGDVMDLLGHLVAKSLVVAEDVGGRARYRYLEMVRAFAEERLGASGEAEAVYGQLLGWCVQVAEAAEPKLKSSEQITYLRRLDAELDNIRAAFDASFAMGLPADATLRLASALPPFHDWRGTVIEGGEWIEHALARAENASDSLRAKALNGLGLVARSLGQQERGQKAFERCLDLRRHMGDERGAGQALGNLAATLAGQGDFSGARACLDESIVIARKLDDRRALAVAMMSHGAIANILGEGAAGIEWNANSLRIWRELGEPGAIAAALDNLGQAALGLSRLDEARAYLEESITLTRVFGDPRPVASRLEVFAMVNIELGCLDAARGNLRESLALWQESRDLAWPAGFLRAAAILASAEGQLSLAVRLLGASAALLASTGGGQTIYDQQRVDRVALGARAALGIDKFDATLAEGEGLERAQAIALATGFLNEDTADRPPSSQGLPNQS